MRCLNFLAIGLIFLIILACTQKVDIEAERAKVKTVPAVALSIRSGHRTATY